MAVLETKQDALDGRQDRVERRVNVALVLYALIPIGVLVGVFYRAIARLIG